MCLGERLGKVIILYFSQLLLGLTHLLTQVTYVSQKGAQTGFQFGQKVACVPFNGR